MFLFEAVGLWHMCHINVMVPGKIQFSKETMGFAHLSIEFCSFSLIWALACSAMVDSIDKSEAIGWALCGCMKNGFWAKRISTNSVIWCVCVWNECMYVYIIYIYIDLSIKLFIDLWTYLSKSSWIESIQMESNTINLISSYLIWSHLILSYLTYLPVCMSVCLAACLCVCLLASLLACLIACLPASVAGWLFVHLFVYLSIHLSNQILTTQT